MKRMATMAEAYQVLLAPHNPMVLYLLLLHRMYVLPFPISSVRSLCSMMFPGEIL